MKTGEIVPNFEAFDQNGAKVTLESLVKSGPMVLFFYPKAMTPG
jgi:peroxiredoxin Q/BCP